MSESSRSWGLIVPFYGCVEMLECFVLCSGTVEDTEMIEGLVFTQRVATPTLTSVEKAKIGLIQFQLSPPKTDVCVR